MSRLGELQVAGMILTRLPMGHVSGPLPALSRCTWAFPVVGAGIGLLSGLTFAHSVSLGVPPLAAAMLALAVASLATGGLHEDGLADMADGFGGGKTVDAKLSIMKDSRIGSFGVLALIFILGVTAAGIASTGSLFGFVAIGAASRSAMLLPMTLLPPARSEGLGHSAATKFDNGVLFALIVGVVLMLLAGQVSGILMMAIVAMAVCGLAKRQIGGQTGDILGATQKLAECAAWLAASAGNV